MELEHQGSHCNLNKGCKYPLLELLEFSCTWKLQFELSSMSCKAQNVTCQENLGNTNRFLRKNIVLPSHNLLLQLQNSPASCWQCLFYDMPSHCCRPILLLYLHLLELHYFASNWDEQHTWNYLNFIQSDLFKQIMTSLNILTNDPKLHWSKSFYPRLWLHADHWQCIVWTSF